MREVRAMPRLCQLYPGICLTTEEKARKSLSDSREKRVIAFACLCVCASKAPTEIIFVKFLIGDLMRKFVHKSQL
jgi:hypothetical protein